MNWEPGVPLHTHPWHDPYIDQEVRDLLEFMDTHDERFAMLGGCLACVDGYALGRGVVWSRLFEAVSA